jgi:hypothetical protein
MNVISADNEAQLGGPNDVSAISYNEGEYGDTQEESALFRDLEKSASAAQRSALDYSADDLQDEIPEPDTEDVFPEDIDISPIVVVEVRDEEPLGIVCASVEAISPRSFCNGLRVLSCKDRSRRAKFLVGDIITAVNGLSILKMTGEKALALIRRASNRRIEVVRKQRQQAAPAGGKGDGSSSFIAGEGLEEDVSADAPNFDDGHTFSTALGGLCRRYTQRVSRSALFAGGHPVKVDCNRLTEPTMEAWKDILPGGKRVPGKDSAYTEVLHRFDRRMKRRKGSSSC